MVDQIRFIDVRYLVGDPVDYLTRDRLMDVELALAHYLDAHEQAWLGVATDPAPTTRHH